MITRLRTMLLLFLLAAVVVSMGRVHAQTTLGITDVLHPYRLSATLLANGHFSISTRYTGTDKTLVYQEDGSGNKPVNHTSHVHFKVDSIIFQLPFELNPVTREAPPEHPLQITQLYRDTLNGIPRINARMFGVMPDGDTISFIFTMEPSQRPSGGFIRMSTEVANTTSRKRSVGVLMLVDTKIGDNDQVPIISSFGYRTVETEFERSVLPGMPEFWLGLEGTPVAPGLVARGNLRASGLIEPDFFLFGNWKDNTAVAGATGLDLVQWKERRAFNVGYTDSAVLLVWDEEEMSPGEVRQRSATEIGIVDSMSVGRGGTVVGDIALGGAGIGGDGCLAFEPQMQTSCSDTNFHPYLPDSLQSLYLVTNTGTGPIANVRIVVPNLPAGLTVAIASSDVVPATLAGGITGVATLTFHALPRLNRRTYSVPIAVVANAADTVMHDTLCVTVAGLHASIQADAATFPPLCPGLDDTIMVEARLVGTRCLDLLPRPQLLGSSPDIDHFEILDPLPAMIPATGAAFVPVRYVAGVSGDTHRVKVVVMATEQGLNDQDRDTTVVISDTVDVVGISRDAEFIFAESTDTLDMGRVCVGDTTLRDWLVTNNGGCALTIRRDYSFENDPLGAFSVANDTRFPLTVGRGSDERIDIRFVPRSAGVSTARFIIQSDAMPFLDTLIIRGEGDTPTYRLGNPTPGPDTVCPGERITLGLPITNPTSCQVVISGVRSDDSRFRVDTVGFVLPPKSSRTIIVTALLDTPGVYTTNIVVGSTEAGDSTIQIRTVVASRELLAPTDLQFGDVTLGGTGLPQRVTLRSTGSADVVITGVRLSGANASEYSYTLPNSETFPLRLAPNATVEVELILAPTDREQRRAVLVVETTLGNLCHPVAPINLVGRGVAPVVDAPRRRFDIGRTCAGTTRDTMIALRNRGNAPLHVTNLVAEQIAGSLKVTPHGLPTVIQADSTIQLRVTLEPASLGPLDVALHVVTDGGWFTEPDTTIRVEGTGVICGTIRADTIRARIGDRVQVPIHLDASPLTATDVARLMNESNSRSIAMSVRATSDLLRFDQVASGEGLMIGRPTVSIVTPAGAEGRITGDNSSGDLTASNLVATFTADVLLGSNDRTVLELVVATFADGYSDLRVENGLLLAGYCAIDQRYVRISGPVMRPTTTPLSSSSGMLVMHLTENTPRATVKLYDPLGNCIAILHDAPALSGTQQLSLAPYNLGSGIYNAVLTTDKATAATQIVVIQ